MAAIVAAIITTVVLVYVTPNQRTPDAAPYPKAPRVKPNKNRQKINAENEMFRSRAVHKIFVTVNKEGAEAAVATNLSVSIESMSI